MGATWLKRLATLLVTIGVSVLPPVLGQDVPPLPESGSKSAAAIKVDAPAAEAAKRPTNDQGVAEPKGADEPALPDADPAAARAEASAMLEKLPKDDSKEATSATKALRAALMDRLHCLDEYQKALDERHAAENPDPSPEKLAADWKADLERVKATLDQTAKEPDALLPASFRGSAVTMTETRHSELKEAIETAQAELKAWSGKLEQFRSDPTRQGGGAAASVRTLRDKAHQQLTGLKARNAEREAALADAKSAEAQEIARQKLVNGQWETRVEAERLSALEALLSLETRRSELSGSYLQVLDAHTQLAPQLDRMKEHYRTIALRQENDLHQAAAKEQTRAAGAGDPLERYLAKRAAEMLELEARVVRSENALTTSPKPSYEDQRSLADRAETDLSNIEKLLDDGRVSHLDALRLNNDFRRLGAERSRIVSHELAIAADRLARAENALSAVELELIYGSRDDRFEFDNLLERIPAARHPQAIKAFDDFEHKLIALLNRRRQALDTLAQRADQTHEQVLRRLGILDDHFGFIRTHMFWVRDEETIGPATLEQAQRELKQLARASFRLVQSACDRATWGRLSVEFLVAALGLIVLPWPLRRAQLALRAVAHKLPAT